jgi:uncharacterized repeat protein (TIGR03847 family)
VNYLERSQQLGRNYNFEEVTFLSVGTIGQPGNRVFYLWAEYLGEQLALKVEKVQVASLVQLLAQLLEDLARPKELPALPPIPSDLTYDFVAGSIAIAYDEIRDLIVIEIDEATADDDPASAVFGLTREQAAALAIEGTRAVEGGRPPCPLCGYPLDRNGHSCPRTNGHRAPNL